MYRDDTGTTGVECRAVEATASFLLRVEKQERKGLTPRCAVLAAGTEVGLDPADLIRRARRPAAP